MSDARWTMIEGDALDACAAQESTSADAAVMDPPYCSGSVGEAQRVRATGQGIRSERLRKLSWFTGDNMGTAGLVFLLRSLAFDLLRVVKPTGSLIVFCDWRMLPSIAPAIESSGWRYQALVVWDKGSMGLGSGFRCQHELALHFTAGDPVYHSKSIPNVIRSARVETEEREHQAQKPVDLLRKIVRVVAPPHGVVFDPFAGSGSTGVAALLEGRRFLGAERSAEHCETARRRLEEAAAAGVQLDLGEEGPEPAPALQLELGGAT